jgi:hypothetical protein
MSLKQDLKINELDERWVCFSLQSTDDIIKNYGINYFVENLNRYSKIALSDYYRKVIEKNDADTM